MRVNSDDATNWDMGNKDVHLAMNLSSSLDNIPKDGTGGQGATRPIWIAATSDNLDAMRDFYIGALGMTETDPPGGVGKVTGFFAQYGPKIFFIGLTPAFVHVKEAVPVIRAPQLDDIVATLTAAGFAVMPDDSLAYARRLLVIDPNGNQFAIIGA